MANSPVPFQFTRYPLENLSNPTNTSIPWLVDGYLAFGEVSCIAGDGGAGKSALAQSLALAACTGEKWLGEFIVRGAPFPVLYIDDENPEPLVQVRWPRLLRGLGKKTSLFPQLPLHLVLQQGVHLPNSDRYRAFMALVKEIQPRLIIFDSWTKMITGVQNENDNMQISWIFENRLKPLWNDLGAHVMLIHHMSKPNQANGEEAKLGYRLRGASDIRNQVRNLLLLTSGKTPQEPRTLYHDKCSWATTKPPASIIFHGDPWLDDHMHLEWVQAAGFAVTDTILALVGGVSLEEGISTGDIIDTVREEHSLSQAAAKAAATRALNRLCERGQLTKVKQGRHTFYYPVPTTAEEADRD